MASLSRSLYDMPGPVPHRDVLLWRQRDLPMIIKNDLKFQIGRYQPRAICLDTILTEALAEVWLLKHVTRDWYLPIWNKEVILDSFSRWILTIIRILLASLLLLTQITYFSQCQFQGPITKKICRLNLTFNNAYAKRTNALWNYDLKSKGSCNIAEETQYIFWQRTAKWEDHEYSKDVKKCMSLPCFGSEIRNHILAVIEKSGYLKYFFGMCH